MYFLPTRAPARQSLSALSPPACRPSAAWRDMRRNFFTEHGKIRGRDKAIGKGNLRKVPVGTDNVMQDVFRAAVVPPLKGRHLELYLEFALEIAHTHVGQLGKLADAVYFFIILQYEILEVPACPYDAFQQVVELLRPVVTTQKRTQLFLLQLMVMEAFQSVVQ